ncbi:hypothetical protein ABW19_dt0201561 [Dactylella cylindrospora]|nr:hypothetical protein ABW19_dt0201561 [Dactylella cylindrospora]
MMEISTNPLEPTMGVGTSALQLIGAGVVAYNLWKFILWIHLYFIRRSTLQRYLAVKSPKNEAPWALVTGSSDGIGKELATLLASKGFNIVLHGRTPQKLANLSQQLESSYPGIKTKSLMVDAADLPADFEKIVNRVLGDISITILINCAGGVFGAVPLIYVPLAERSASEVDRIINFNIRFMTHLTRIVLPRMTQLGLIINISSLSYSGLPLVQVYSSTKSYLNTLSTALSVELAATEKNIEVLCMPLGAVTGTPGNPEGGSSMSPDSKTIAKAILGRVGCGRRMVVPYWFNSIEAFSLSLMPDAMYPAVVTGLMVDLKAKEVERLAKQK